MGKKKKIKINESSNPNKNISEDKNPKINGNKGIILDFSSPTSFYSCKVGRKYTNYLKNPKEFIGIRRKIFSEALSYFRKTTIDKLNCKSGHTHVIGDKRIDLVGEILMQLFKKVYPNNNKIEIIVNNYLSGDIWQLGYTNGLRFVGIRDDNIFNVLFIDYHHLIEADEKYNQKDYLNFEYCPMTSEYCEKCKKIAEK